jgi:hypothetical protein
VHGGSEQKFGNIIQHNTSTPCLSQQDISKLIYRSSATSSVCYLIIPKIHPFPDYFATLTFWGSEWCSGDSSCPLGCAPYSGGYQANIPPFIQSTLNIMPKIGISSRNLLLGLHAKGIDSNIITLVSANHTE